MAYTKQTWETGEVITAEKLNHIEDGIVEGNNQGYEYSIESQEIINESVTVSSTPNSYYAVLFSYNELIDADSIIVTFDGQQYELSKTVSGNSNYYGGSYIGDFSQNPFMIESSLYNNNVYNNLYTPNAGTYSVKVTANTASVNSVTPCFDLAVRRVFAGIERIEVFPVNIDRSGDTFYTNGIYNDVKQAYFDGKILVANVSQQQENKYEGFLAGIEDEYGNINFKFIFLKPLSDNSGLECAIVKLKYDDTVTATIKKIALENLT